jgi:DnaJ family protein A protein 2
MKEFYDILELPENCTVEDIKKSYKKKAILLHPDKGGSKEQFQKLNEAYETLSNPEKRSKYDSPPMNDFFQFFQNFSFPGFHFQGNQGKDNHIQIKVPMTLNEIYCGSLKQISYSRKKKCLNCNGKGGHNCSQCPQCNGSGQNVIRIQLGPNMIQQQVSPCNKCDATGFSYKDVCNECKGNTSISVEETININIPSGIDNNNVIKFEKLGNDNGDLNVIVEQQPHNYFERQQNNLFYKLHISLGEALLGFCKNLTLLDNKVIQLKCENCTSPFSKWEIKDYGMPILNSNMKGNLIIEFIVAFPLTITPSEKEVIQTIFTVQNENTNDCITLHKL